MKIRSTIGATTISTHGDTFQAGKDGAFDVPDHVARDLVAFPQWEDEQQHAARLLVEKAKRDADPETMVERLTALEEIVAGLVRKSRKSRTSV